MAKPQNPHDKFFRASMQNTAIAKAFFQHHLPSPLRNALNFSAIKLENSTYIDDTLQETTSDLVFDCHYNKDISDSKAKVVLLVEHQSSPDRLMPFRVYHYLFNMLYSLKKQRPKSQANDKLPAVYALVFYNGKQSPYPYSMHLADAFDDPLNIMSKMLENPVSLIDVNQIQDDELKQQRLLGIITAALKYIRDRDILIKLREIVDSMDLSDYQTLNLNKTLSSYIFAAGKIIDIEQFIKDSRQLPEPIRGEFMTIAEQLQAMGEEIGLKKGQEKGREEVAINLLKEGADPRFISRIAGLELAVILKLKAQLEEE